MKGPGDKSAAKLSSLQFLLTVGPCLFLTFFRIGYLCMPRPLNDFITYWAAGHLFLQGQNPYSASAVIALESAMGYDQPLVMLNPPWSIPLMVLFGSVSFSLAHMVWLLLVLCMEVACVLLLWRYFGGEKKKSWIALLVLASFLPAGITEQLGQITPLLLVGLTAFLWMMRRQQYMWAGVSLYLLTLKPHLCWLIFLAIFLWALQRRVWSLIVLPVLICLAGATLAFVWNPATLGYFHQTSQSALGSICGLAYLMGPWVFTHYPWLRFLPMLVGIWWFIGYWKKYHQHWSWAEHVPLLLLVSICTSPYYWVHDFEFALPALIVVAVKTSRMQGRWMLVPVMWFVFQIIIIGSEVFTGGWMAAVSVLWIVYWQLSQRFLRNAVDLPTE